MTKTAPKLYQQTLTAATTLTKQDWLELWRRRELLFVLVRRDLQVRYKNTALGILWVILQPLLASLIFTFIFSQVLRFGTDQPNYLVSTFLGFALWQFFSTSLTQAAGSVYEQIAIVKKIYFPRVYLPLTIIIRAFFDFCISFLLLLVLMLTQGVSFTAASLFFFLTTALVLAVFTSGLSFIFASLNARFRDFRHLTPFIVQIWFYATPVFYPASLLQNTPLAFLNYLNPLALILDAIRQAIFSHSYAWGTLAIFFLLSLLLFLLGFYIFKKMETLVVDWT